MKKTCKRCGQIFDYEEQMGICPKCGKYASNYDDGDDEEMFRSTYRVERESTFDVIKSGKKKEWQQSYEYPVMQRAAHERQAKQGTTYAKRAAQKKGFGEKSIARIIACVFLIAIMIGLPIIQKYYTNQKIERLSKELRVDNLTEISVRPEEEFTVADVQCTLYDLKVFEHEGVSAPVGWKYIECSYSCKAKEHYHDAGYKSEIFFQYEGHYIKPLYSLDLSDDEVVINSLYDENINTRLEGNEGRWVFMVPEQVADGYLEIYEMQDVEDEYRKVKCVYSILMELEG